MREKPLFIKVLVHETVLMKINSLTSEKHSYFTRSKATCSSVLNHIYAGYYFHLLVEKIINTNTYQETYSDQTVLSKNGSSAS